MPKRLIWSAPSSLRLLLRNKRFATLAILSLGVAIALNTTMYSVVDAMIRPRLAVPRPDRLVEIEYFGDYRMRVPIRDRNRDLNENATFHSGAAAVAQDFAGNIIEAGNVLANARILTVTPEFFRVMGVRATAGRLLSSGDAQSEPSAIVLSERMWRRLFPVRESFDTASVLLNGDPRLVVGLLPYEADGPGLYTDVWQLPPAARTAAMPLRLFRLRDGVTIEQAQAELAVLSQRILERSGGTTYQTGFRVRPWPWFKPQFRTSRFHLALIGGVAAVLLIACANLANLQLARGVGRTRELATRAAVGASRGAIVRQLLGETAWLALGGLILGALLTWWGIQLVRSAVPETLAEYVTRPQTSWRVMAFAIVATMFCLLTVGLLPALKLSRLDVNTLLKSGAGTGQSRTARRQYAYLVVFEVALALAVLCAAGLLWRAALALRYQTPEQLRELATAYVGVVPAEGERLTRRQWSERILQRVTATDEVTGAATVAYARPRRNAVTVDDPGGGDLRVLPALGWTYFVVSPDFLRVMQFPVVEGRDFLPGEFAEPQVIVDRRTAAFLWPGQDPIGRLVKLDSPQVAAPWLRVVGIADPPQAGPNPDGGFLHDPRRTLAQLWVLNAFDSAVVLPPTGRSRRGAGFEVLARARRDARRLPVLLRRTLDLDPAMRIEHVNTLEDALGLWVRREKHDFIAGMFGVFGYLALALAAIGVYSVVSHGVAQRTREFGVRVAVGASARDIRELVLREGSLLALMGIALGLLIVKATAGTLRAFLLEDSAHRDSLVFAVVALALFAVAWLASWIPARRATRINPIEALRND